MEYKFALLTIFIQLIHEGNKYEKRSFISFSQESLNAVAENMKFHNISKEHNKGYDHNSLTTPYE